MPSAADGRGKTRGRGKKAREAAGSYRSRLPLLATFSAVTM